MQPNVLLVILDCVRARSTSLHGYEARTTPFLERFSERATTYWQARASGQNSIQSHASIFTGLSVPEHRLQTVDQRIDPERTIWSELAGEGYRTGVFSYNSYLTQAPVGLADSFQTVESGDDQRIPFPDACDPAEVEADGIGKFWEFLSMAARSGNVPGSIVNGLSLWDGTASLLPESLRGYDVVPDEVFTDLFTDWHADRDGPWAACINYMGAHTPYEPRDEHNHWAGPEERALMDAIDEHTWEFIGGRRPWEERRALEGLYDGCVRQVDAEVERLLSVLADRSDLSETLVVITADHGEGFGEPGAVRPVPSAAHGNTGGPEEQILHVPLLVSRPGQTESREVSRVASLTRFPDVVRAVRAGDATDASFVPSDGTVISAGCDMRDGDRATVPEYVTDFAAYEPGGEVLYRTTADGRVRKDVRWNGEYSAFDCTDPLETVELDDPDRSAVDAAFDALTLSDAVVRTEGEPSDEVKDRLEQLGYR